MRVRRISGRSRIVGRIARGRSKMRRRDASPRPLDARRLRRLRAAVGVATAILALTVAVGVRRVVAERRRAEARAGELILGLPRVGPLAALAFDLEGARLSAVTDGRLHAWDLATGAPVRDTPIGSDGPAAFLGDTGSLVTASADGALDLVPPSGPTRRLGEAGGRVRALVTSANGKWAAAATDAAIVVVSASKAPSTAASPGRRAAWRGSPLSPDGTRLAAAAENRSAWVYDLRSGRGHALEGRLSKLSPILFLPGQEPRLLGAGADGALSLWSLPSGDPRRLPGPRTPRWSSPCPPTALRAATAVREVNEVRVWDLATGEARLLGAHPGPVAARAVSPRGEPRAAAAQDGARVWPARRGPVRTP